METQANEIPDIQWNLEILERQWDLFKLARSVWGHLECEPEEMEHWGYDEKLDAYVIGQTDDETGCIVQILIPKKHIGSYKETV